MNTLNFPKLFRHLVFALAAVYLIVYIYIVVSRISYPYELEWIEGGMLQVVQRVVKGQDIYVPPSLEYVPFLYPPVYFYLSAGFSLILGNGFFPLRLVSVIASILSFYTIYRIVLEETGDWWSAFISMGLFAACYRVTGAWLDIARVDSLFLALSLLAIYFGRKNGLISYSLLSGFFSALAIMTKQTGLILAIPLLVYLLFRDWKHGLAYLGALGLSFLPLAILLDQKTGGWYTYYVYELLSQQAEWLPIEFINFWKNDLIVHLPFTIMIIAYFLSDEYKTNKKNLLMWVLILSGAVASSFLSRVKIGGYDNVLLPMFAILSILTGLGFQRLLPLNNSNYFKKADLSIWIACLLQLIILAYNPFAQIPRKADLLIGNQLIKYLSNFEGDIYIPDHGYLASRVGKSPYAHHAAIWDVMRTDQITEGKQFLGKQLEETIQSQLFDFIIMDETGNYCCPDIDTYYTRVGEVIDNAISFYPVTGDRRRPTYLYVANHLR